MSEPVPPAPDDTTDDIADRTSERRSFFLSTAITLAGRARVQARIRNLSAGGMMVELEQAPDPEWAPGDRLSADLRNIGLVKGEIAWADGRRFGVSFDREVDPEVARKPVTYGGEMTPDYLKPIRVPDRALGKMTETMKAR